MGDKILIKQIIERVQQHPVLYDSSLSCQKYLKEVLWKEIADALDIDVQVLKLKWRNLRDCYTKHIRAQNDNSKTNSSSSYKFWHWSIYLDFLKPLIRPNTEVVNTNDTDDENTAKDNYDNTFTISDLNLEVEFDHHTNFGSNSEHVGHILKNQTRYSKQKRSRNNYAPHYGNVECVTHKKKRRLNLKEKSKADINDFGGIELIFLGYAQTIKKMPVKRQISVKIKIAKIMMEEEFKFLEHE